MEEKKKRNKVTKRSPAKKKLVKVKSVKAKPRQVKRRRSVKKTVAVKSSLPVVSPVTPAVAAEPALTLPPVVTELPTPVVELPIGPLSYNRTKVWAAVAITMAAIIMVWVYALPYSLTVSGNNSTAQLTEAADSNVNQLMSDIKQGWNNLTQQAVNLSETTINTNTTTTNQTVNQALPTNEELDNLFSDIN